MSDRRARPDELDTRVEAVPSWLFWGLTALGLAVIGFGLYGIWTHQGTGPSMCGCGRC